MSDGLKNVHRRLMIAIRAAHPRVERVVPVGSRATGTHAPASDVDLVLFGEALALDDQSELADLPMAQQADLLLHHRITSRELLDHIAAHGVEWFRRTHA